MTHPSASKDAAWLLLGQWIAQAFTAAAGLVVIRALHPVDFGIYSLAGTLVAGILPLAEFGLNPGLGRDIALAPRQARRLWQRVTAVRLLLGLALVLIAVVALRRGVPGNVTSQGAALLLALSPALLARLLWSGLTPAWLALGRPLRAAQIAALVPAISALGGVIATLIRPDPLSVAVGQSAFALFGLIALPSQRPPAEVGAQSSAPVPLRLNEGLPLALASLATALYLQVDLWIVDRTLGLGPAGHYGAALRILTLALAVPSAWGAAQVAHLARSTDPVAETWRATRRMATVGLVVAGCVVLGATALGFVLGPEYVEAGIPLRWLAPVVGFACVSAPATTALLVAGRTQRVLGLAVLGLAVDLLLASLWAGPFGPAGIAAAKSVAAAAQCGATLLAVAVRPPRHEGPTARPLSPTAAAAPADPAAFDDAAATYDAIIAENQSLRWMRSDNLARLEGLFAPDAALLELGCGTGEEAAALARSGRCITALDPSPAMLVVARARAAAEGLTDRITLVTATAGCLAEALPADARFDGAYSSLGPLNCENDLRAVASALAGRLRSGAPVVVSLMSRSCLSEQVHYLLRLRPRAAFRRLRRGSHRLPARAGGAAKTELWFRDPRELIEAFGTDFEVVAVEPFPFVLPAPSLRLRLPSTLFRWLAAWERRVRRISTLAPFGDHFRITLRRR
ncbi:MAG: methyltransferase domain-containing protein [Candidatus Eisenbacteria bacterium]|nr:methyltransferase domain-containing protein [Candidatus Eisenbacteria bacterium]MCC7144159.1 methyltransferase domain-containing protein [Candidatus Eisenbacteria bacterium]